jgi:hypothetical protein
MEILVHRQGEDSHLLLRFINIVFYERLVDPVQFEIIDRWT